MRIPVLRCLCLTIMISAISACGSEPQQSQKPATKDKSSSVVKANSDSQNDIDVNIRWTSFGIPHVKADDWRSIGYGFAYATATDGVCVIARDIVTVKGQQEKFFGKALRPIDLFHRAVIDKTLLSKFSKAQSPKEQEFSAGYVKGYNRYLIDNAGKLPASCDSAEWVRPIDLNDMNRLVVGVAIRYGLGQYLKQIVSAHPPVDDKETPQTIGTHEIETAEKPPLASNAIAFGRKVTENGRGILFGNPHYPWSGSSRFHLIHMTIPGEVDVMGTSLLSTARVSIGFNHDVAWSHTVSTGTRATLYKLDLHPDNPTLYRFEDNYREMEARTVELETQSGTELATVYFSHYGPIVARDDLPWNNTTAYTVRDANLLNFHAAKTYDELSKATNVQEIVSALYKY